MRVSFEDALQRRADDGAGAARARVPHVSRHGCRARHGADVCPKCNGSGVVATSQGLFALQQPCPRCRGMGSIVETPCPTCHGAGRERRTKRYTVKIPAGVKDGTRIKLKGKGEAGFGGAAAGDLYVVTRVEPSKIYERRGDDLVVTVPVSFPTAALGGTVEAPTPGGAGVAEDPRRHGGREAAADQGPRRAAPEGRRPGRRARPRPHRGAEAR